MLEVYAIIVGTSLFGFVILLIIWDFLNPEVARLIISGTSRSLLLECMSSPSQTGNLAGLLARKLIGGDTVGAVGFTIGSEVVVYVFYDCCITGLDSGIDTSSPESADGKSQVFAKLNCSSVTNSQEYLTSSAQLGGSWLLFINGNVVNILSKTMWNCGKT